MLEKASKLCEDEKYMEAVKQYDKILQIEDDNIQKWYFEKVSDNPIFNTNVSTLLKNFKV